MAASRMLLVLLSMALLALTSAQRANGVLDDENSLQEQGEDSVDPGGYIHAGLKEIKNHAQEQLSQNSKKAKDVIQRREKLNQGKGQGVNLGSDGEGLRGQNRQSQNQQGRGGQRGRGRGGQRGENGQNGQNAKGGQKIQRGKGGKRNQRENNGELSEE